MAEVVTEFDRLLMVQIHSASSLKDADAFGKSDPFVVVGFDEGEATGGTLEGGCKARTSVKEDTCDPVWNETKFFFLKPGVTSMQVDCFDKDKLQDEGIGNTYLKIEEPGVEEDVALTFSGGDGTVKMSWATFPLSEVVLSMGRVAGLEERIAALTASDEAASADLEAARAEAAAAATEAATTQASLQENLAVAEARCAKLSEAMEADAVSDAAVAEEMKALKAQLAAKDAELTAARASISTKDAAIASKDGEIAKLKATLKKEESKDPFAESAKEIQKAAKQQAKAMQSMMKGMSKGFGW